MVSLFNLSFASLALLFGLPFYTTTSAQTLTGTDSAAATSFGADYPTGSEATYITYSSTITRSPTTSDGSLSTATTSMAANSSRTTTNTESTSVTLLVGGHNSTA